MLFQSGVFFCFFIIVLLLLKITSNTKIRNVVLLASSLYFYTYGAGLQVFLFLAVIIFAYIFAKIAEKNKNKVVFFLMLILLFLPLLLYKYIPFLSEQFFNGSSVNDYFSKFVLPIGISFYTFQAAGYVIDVYRNKYKAERNVIVFATFVSLFPQLVAGPIERADKLLVQIKNPQKVTAKCFNEGINFMVMGYCFKVLLAETLARFVDPVYNNLSNSTGLAILVSTVFFGIQIYCDFNGYTMIARGCGKMMGIDLMKNFDHPYCSKTLSEFWRRWHISLSSWFKDYVYIPLGGNRVGRIRGALNNVITLLLSGIWHGANWTFAIWGLINGIVVGIEKLLNLKPKKRISKYLGWLYTFVIINLSWVFFRADTVSDAFLALRKIAFDSLNHLHNFASLGRFMKFYVQCGWERYAAIPLAVSMLIYVLYEYGHIIRFRLDEKIRYGNRWLSGLVCAMLIVFTLYFGATMEQNAFVYFRF